jgi:hypothetical protein
MPELLENLFDAVSRDVAARTRAPGARRAIARSRRRLVVVAAAGTAALLGILAIPLLDGDPSSVQPAPAPATPSVGLVAGEVPVWYDDAGLHHGDVVEQTAVPLRPRWTLDGRLTLVHAGALYLDPARDEVWLHPWSGEPRVVGHNATHGPAGDHHGDIAVWFEGSTLVVLDTASGREVARVSTPSEPASWSQEHLSKDDGILQVSAEAVVWRSAPDRAQQFDLGTKEITEITAERSPQDWTDGLPGALTDVHDQTELWSWGSADGSTGLSLRAADGNEPEFPDLEATTGRVSPDGRYLLATDRLSHAPAFVDLASGERFLGPPRGERDNLYLWAAWSYGDTALATISDSRQGTLHACGVARRQCEELVSRGLVVLPS